MDLNIRDFARHPYLKEAAQYVRDSGVSLEQMVKSPEFEHIRHAGFKRITEYAVFRKIKFTPLITKEACNNEIFTYCFSRMLLHYQAGGPVVSRYNFSVARLAEQRLSEESLEFLLHVAKQFELKFKPADYGMDLRFTDYLKVMSRICRHEAKWKLVNRSLSKGYVSVAKEELPFLLSNALEPRLFVLSADIPPEIAPMANAISKLGVFMSNSSPPCIRNSLSHRDFSAKFLLATYGYASGLSENNISLILGMKEKDASRLAKYKVPGCEKLSRTRHCVPDIFCDFRKYIPKRILRQLTLPEGCGPHINHPMDYKKRTEALEWIRLHNKDILAEWQSNPDKYAEWTNDMSDEEWKIEFEDEDMPKEKSEEKQ